MHACQNALYLPSCWMCLLHTFIHVNSSHEILRIWRAQENTKASIFLGAGTQRSVLMVCARLQPLPLQLTCAGVSSQSRNSHAIEYRDSRTGHIMYGVYRCVDRLERGISFKVVVQNSLLPQKQRQLRQETENGAILEIQPATELVFFKPNAGHIQ